MLGTFINVATTAYNIISSIKQGTQINNVLNELKRLDFKIDKLSDYIFYAHDIQVVHDTNQSTQKYHDDLRDVRRILEPLQKYVGHPIISSAMIDSPQLLQNSLKDNPWKILVNIRPFKFTEPNLNPNMIPFAFEHSGVNYIGWQTKDSCPLLFNFQYDSDSNLWLSNTSDIENNSKRSSYLNDENFLILSNYLSRKEWGRADWQTIKIIRSISNVNYFDNLKSTRKIPEEVLYTLDDMWRSSDGGPLKERKWVNNSKLEGRGGVTFVPFLGRNTWLYMRFEEVGL